MIELRWHVSFPESKCPESVICGGDIAGKPIRRVLQYRIRILREVAYECEYCWTEWQDVPVVSEEQT